MRTSRCVRRRQDGALGLGVVGVAELAARVEDGVLGDQAVDPRLHGRVERVVGGAQVGELGLAADRRHHVREQHRQRAGLLAERGVRVPELVAQRVEPAVIVARAQLVLGVEVGDVGELRVLQPRSTR